MNSLGAGGAESPYLINAANALVFGLSMSLTSVESCGNFVTDDIFWLLVGFLCVFGGPIANRIGMNWTLLLGAAGYPIYS